MVGRQDIEVPRLHLHVRACIMPEAEGIARIGAAEHDIEVVERAPATVHRLEDGRGVAVVRIDVAERAHGTDAGVGDHLMAHLHGQSIGKEHMVACLVDGLGLVLSWLQDDAAHVLGIAAHVADLIEGEPELDLGAEALEEGMGIAEAEVDEATVPPATVLLDEVPGHLVVGDRNERLDAVGKKAVEELVVVGKPGLVRGLLFARRIDVRPGNGGAQDLEIQLGDSVLSSDESDQLVAKLAVIHK